MSEKFIPGIHPLQQFMEDGSFLMPEIPAVYRAAQALNAPEAFDYDYLLSLSGMAVRLAWQPGWAEYAQLPNQGVFYNQDGRDIVEIALERMGARYVRKALADVGLETAKEEIQASIDRGVPVLIQEPCVYATVLGYRGNTLYGVSTLAEADKRLAPYGYNAFDTWEAETKSYLLIQSFTPRLMDESLLREVLQTAVHQARTAHLACLGGAALGVSAFDALAEMLVWDEGFAPLTPGSRYEGELSFPYRRPDGYYRTDGARTLDQRFWAGYCDFLCMLNGYENFARFLTRYASLRPGWSGPLQEAADDYLHACESSGALWRYVTPDAGGVARFKEKEVRYAFAAHMLRAKIFTLRAVELLEHCLAEP